jgi:hypothetical protein
MHRTYFIHLAQRSRKGGTLPLFAFTSTFLFGFPQLKFHLPTCVLLVKNCNFFFALSVVLVLFGHDYLSLTSEDCDIAIGHRPG